MATILVISFTDSKRDPRAHLQIEALRTHHTVTPAGTAIQNYPMSFRGEIRKLVHPFGTWMKRFDVQVDG